MYIPLIVTLWGKNSDWAVKTGPRRYVFQDTPDLTVTDFNDQATWVEIRRGPDYDADVAEWQEEPAVEFYEHINYTGQMYGISPRLRLSEGLYDLAQLRFSLIISSVRFNQHGYLGGLPRGPLPPITLYVSLFEHENFNGRRLDILWNSPNILDDFGDQFNDIISSVRVIPGPDFAPGQVVQLYRDIDYRGGNIDLPPGDYPNIGVSHGFNDVASSIMFS